MGATAFGRTKVCEILIFVKFIDQKVKIQKVLDPKIEYMYRCLYCDYHVLYPMYFCTVNKKGWRGGACTTPLNLPGHHVIEIHVLSQLSYARNRCRFYRCYFMLAVGEMFSAMTKIL